MKKYRTGIQKQILSLIDYSCNVLKLPYITIEELRKELRQPNESEDQLNHRITQATYQLKRKRQIRDKGYGKYAFNKDRTKHYTKCANLTTKNKRDYCPAKKCFVQGDEQCIAIDGYDGTKKTTMPICLGYTTKKDNVKLSKQRFEVQEASDIGLYRKHNGNQRDPESKYYLPNLVKHEQSFA